MATSIEYFREELVRFRGLMSEREFMLSKDRQNAAVTALGHLYLELNDEDAEACRTSLEATVDELDRRRQHVEADPPAWAN